MQFHKRDALARSIHAAVDLDAIRSPEGLVDPRSLSPAALESHGEPAAAAADSGFRPRFVDVCSESAAFRSITLRLQSQQNHDWLDVLKAHKTAGLEEYKGVRFQLVRAQRVDYGPTLKEYDNHVASMAAGQLPVASKVVFHGCRRLNTGSVKERASVKHSLATKGLVPWSSSSEEMQTDVGWFGDSTRGVYVSKHLDYCLKYAHPDRQAVQVGEQLEVLMLKLVPGRIKQLETSSQYASLPPAPGFDCHESSSYRQELYVYDKTVVDPAEPSRGPRQLLLTHILTIKAVEEQNEVVGADDV